MFVSRPHPFARALICAGIFFLGFFTLRATSVIELVDGGRIQARVIEEKSDRVFLDLGYDILMVPRESIARITVDTDVEEQPEAVFTADLYQEAQTTRELPVKTLVGQLGDSVVTVRTPVGLGSGFIIHPDGYLITNDHVIAGENDISVTVFSSSGERDSNLTRRDYQNVQIIASSPEWDLALLKIDDNEAGPFPAVALGASHELRRGQTVFAIGNPLGLERTVSQGIVSMRNRPIGGRLYVQTTTQINSGNSGGPLFNLHGHVVGVNNMKLVAQGAEGLGFAIPASTLIDFLRNRDAFAFDPRNPNNGYRYNSPPDPMVDAEPSPQ